MLENPRFNVTGPRGYLPKGARTNASDPECIMSQAQATSLESLSMNFRSSWKEDATFSRACQTVGDVLNVAELILIPAGKDLAKPPMTNVWGCFALVNKAKMNPGVGLDSIVVDIDLCRDFFTKNCSIILGNNSSNRNLKAAHSNCQDYGQCKVFINYLRLLMQRYSDKVVCVTPGELVDVRAIVTKQEDMVLVSTTFAPVEVDIMLRQLWQKHAQAVDAKTSSGKSCPTALMDAAAESDRFLNRAQLLRSVDGQLDEERAIFNAIREAAAIWGEDARRKASSIVNANVVNPVNAFVQALMTEGAAIVRPVFVDDSLITELAKYASEKATLRPLSCLTIDEVGSSAVVLDASTARTDVVDAIHRGYAASVYLVRGHKDLYDCGGGLNASFAKWWSVYN